jgi:hypothetical protein
MKTLKRRFALCINNTDYEVSLIPKKVYEIIPDDEAAKDDFIRIIDESGEDYLYHMSYFLIVEFSDEVEKALMAN